LASKPIAVFTSWLMRPSSSADRGCQVVVPSGARCSVPSTITATLMRWICACSRAVVWTVLPIS